jgi:hypothetical protein
LLSCGLAFSLLYLAPASLGFIRSARADEPVYACGVQDAGGANNIFSGYETFGIVTSNYCGQPEQSLQLSNDSKNTIPPGMFSGWIATAPSGIEIAGAAVPNMQLFSTVGTGYIADFYWTGGSQRVDDAWHSYSVGGLAAPQFGFALGCSPSGTNCPADAAAFLVDDIQLDVHETVNPSVTALGSNNLWYKGASGYVHGGGWSIAYSASSPSGIAAMSASENGQPVQLPIPPGCPVPNHTVWQQCPGTQTWSPTVSLSGTGDQQLTLGATSAAANTSSPSEAIHVDSVQPAVSLSGPTTASSEAGTQYVTATASVGPSGLGSIDCSTDGGPARSFISSPATIPVSGLGNHSVSCTATNRSYDSTGAPATSTPVDWSLNIQQPSAMAATFAKIRGLKCRKVRVREKIPAHWVTVRRHGKPVRVKRRARTIVHKVRQCHARVVTRKICHAHHCRRQHFVIPPHTALMSKLRVGYGKSAPVFGQLITSSGIPLAGQPVQIMTAPDDGSNAFTEAAAATTNVNGAWTAVLPPGPGRLVEAVYPGTSTVAQATSGQLQLIVPAKVKLLSASPRRVAWGHSVRITGKLLGGYLPAGGVNVRLRIGFGSHYTTYGVHEHVAGDGRFSTTYPFGLGSPGAFRTYWFAVASLPSGNYPYAPAASGRKYVTVGGHPRTTTTTSHHKRKRRRKRRR